MTRFLICVFALFFLNVSSASEDEYYEDGAEFIRIDIQMNGDSSGTLWGTVCSSCTPKRIVIDGGTEFWMKGEPIGIDDIETIQGKAATVIWERDTQNALRVIPFEY